MHPIFFEADPYSLLKNNQQYRYFIVLLYDKNSNERFRKELRRNYIDVHENTGKHTCVIDFDIPPKAWLEKYLTWFINKYKDEDENLEVENFKSLEYLREFGIDAYEEMKRLFDQYQVGSSSIQLQKHLMEIFFVSNSDFPTALIFDCKESNKFAMRKQLNNNILDAIAMKLARCNSLDEVQEIDVKMSGTSLNLIEIFKIIKNPYSSAFEELLDVVTAGKCEGENTKNSVGELLKKYKEFENLEFPENFSWKPSLEKYIRRHKDYLSSFVKQVNLLETHPNANSLDLKPIRNFKRFRVNDSFRGLFYEKQNVKEFFAFGHHDLGL
jgi:hypothetical protein